MTRLLLTVLYGISSLMLAGCQTFAAKSVRTPIMIECIADICNGSTVDLPLRQPQGRHPLLPTDSGWPLAMASNFSDHCPFGWICLPEGTVIDTGQTVFPTYSGPSRKEVFKVQYHWNAHALKGRGIKGRTVGPQAAIQVLRPNEYYTFRFTLTVPPDVAPGVISVGASDEFVGAVDMSAQADNEQASLDVDSVLLVDPAYFVPPRRKSERLTLNVSAMRAAAKHDLLVRRSGISALALEPLRAEGEPRYFATFTVTLRTRRAEGLGTIALSLWQESQPLDEVVFQFCITKPGSEHCREHRPGHEPGGSGFLMTASSGEHDDQRLDAGIHLVEIGGAVHGVLRTRQPDRSYRTDSWLAAGRPEKLHTTLAQLQASRRLTANHGIGLLNDLFGRDEQEQRAKRAFKKFVESEGFDVLQKNRPVLNFRYLAENSGPLLYPIALVRTSDTSTPIGYGFQVQHSLEYPRQRRTATCVKDWWPVLDVEPSDDALLGAIEALNGDAARIAWDDDGRSVRLRPWRNHDTSYPITTDLQAFNNEVKYDTAFPERGLVLMGHHGKGVFSFDPSADTGERTATLNASLIAATFAPPSFALLAMCSSAEVGYNTLVDALSQAGVESMVLTSTRVSGALAGHFIGCFFDTIANHPDRQVPLHDAFDGALRCLYTELQYRDELLSFMLVGNPNLLLCRPN